MASLPAMLPSSTSALEDTEIDFPAVIATGLVTVISVFAKVKTGRNTVGHVLGTNVGTDVGANVGAAWSANLSAVQCHGINQNYFKTPQQKKINQ